MPITTYWKYHSVYENKKPKRKGNHLYRPLRSKKKRLLKKYGIYCDRCHVMHRTDDEMTQERADNILTKRFAKGIRKAEDADIMKHFEALLVP